MLYAYDTATNRPRRECASVLTLGLFTMKPGRCVGIHDVIVEGGEREERGGGGGEGGGGAGKLTLFDLVSIFRGLFLNSVGVQIAFVLH